MGVRGAIQIDRTMATHVPDIYAAGDCAETYHRLTQRPTYLPLGTTVHKQGRVAGENAVEVSSRVRRFLGHTSAQSF